jgi:hypothetical protein
MIELFLVIEGIFTRVAISRINLFLKGGLFYCSILFLLRGALPQIYILYCFYVIMILNNDKYYHALYLINVECYIVKKIYHKFIDQL